MKGIAAEQYLPYTSLVIQPSLSGRLNMEVPLLCWQRVDECISRMVQRTQRDRPYGPNPLRNDINRMIWLTFPMKIEWTCSDCCCDCLLVYPSNRGFPCSYGLIYTLSMRTGIRGDKTALPFVSPFFPTVPSPSAIFACKSWRTLWYSSWEIQYDRISVSVCCTACEARRWPTIQPLHDLKQLAVPVV